VVYDPCPDACSNVFDRVVVSRVIVGGTVVAWDLLASFADPLPWTFTLQAGTTGNPAATDWAAVGPAVTQAFYAVDPVQRVYGTTDWTYYRVQLVTSLGTYYSDPVNGLGTLPMRDWRLARELVRKERLLARLGFQDGYLLKRKVSGQPCSCLDPRTREVLRPGHTECYGVGYEGGYYAPMPCVWAGLRPKATRIQLDAGQGRGTVNDVAVAARMLFVPVMIEEDVWVSAKTDDRYFVHEIQNVAEFRGVGVVADVMLRPAQFTHVIYNFPVPAPVPGGPSGDC